MPARIDTGRPYTGFVPPPRSVNMDTPEKPDKPRRRWWRRKRWQAGGLVGAFVAYEAAFGPALYCYTRGWTPSWTLRLSPEVLPESAYRAVGLSAFYEWCRDAGWRHRGIVPRGG